MLCRILLSGPTLFGRVVNKAAEITVETLKYNQSKYFVLFIITDGVITNMQETIDALMRASGVSLSILIVGVGSIDFSQMEVLDADNGHLLESSTGRVAARDIVQFVPMRELHS
ncbi:Protein BONZAI 3 [Capsicum chinense]|nr:Protein BONZAI 3 [Capsicum chinense]